ncbi:hypothetical protein CPB84DRAFT_1744250 [Gymnopilus junonius]|uniref:Uncharacterized protein n=1 Tax=Gymnopilus junonius TaxID=109634 RepID=A0A9P5TSF2_GYMJU|nr:hypothetical protein CPB84DRAFT_1744250 [Gymnopilus junonius]
MAMNPFIAQRYKAQSAGIAIVRRILARESFPEGFTTSELYKLASQEPAPADFEPYPLKRPPPPPPLTKKQKYQQPTPPRSYPENPDHPIRSVRFLKEFILPFLAGAKEIAMTRHFTAKTLAAREAGELPKKGTPLTSSQVQWKWKVIPPEARSEAPVPKNMREVFGQEVGVDVDTSHLNNRRLNGRKVKVSREVENMKDYVRYSAERDGLIERLEKDSELTVKLVDSMERSGNKGGLRAVLEKEQLVKQDRSRHGTSIASSDSDEYVKAQVDKIRELVAYKTRVADSGVRTGN